MNSLVESLPLLIAMAVAILFSAFFSASEAALFSLRRVARKAIAKGNPGERIAARLLNDPDRLLSAILFWNLVINIAYFVLGSIVALRIDEDENASQSLAVIFAVGSLLTLIFCCEMLPKTFAVLQARRLAGLVAYPLALSVRVADPFMPALIAVNRVSQRIIWPNLKYEVSLDISDLERAVHLSSDERLGKQDQAILRNIVQLSDIRIDEWMRPRSQYRAFRPPVSISDLGDDVPPGGYLLITEKDSDEIEFAVRLNEAWQLSETNLEQRATRCLHAPWCATMSEVFDKMRSRDRHVTAVVNEHGETIGVLTLDDIMEAVFTFEPSRSRTILDQSPIHFLETGKWLVSGMTNLRRIKPLVKTELPQTRCVTVSGVIQESLQRIAHVGDECDWGPFNFRVLEMPQRGHMLIEMIIVSEFGEQT